MWLTLYQSTPPATELDNGNDDNCEGSKNIIQNNNNKENIFFHSRTLMKHLEKYPIALK